MFKCLNDCCELGQRKIGRIMRIENLHLFCQFFVNFYPYSLMTLWCQNPMLMTLTKKQRWAGTQEPTEDLSLDSRRTLQIGATLICMFLWFLSWCGSRENLCLPHLEPKDCRHRILDVFPADQESVKWIQVGELLFAPLTKLEAIICC